jgi:hypothetical protein
VSRVKTRASNRTVFHWKPNGNSRWTFGVYRWSRWSGSRFDPKGIKKEGIVLRMGPAGHVQGQVYSVRPTGGRVRRRSVMVSTWGVRGRRGKRYVEVSVGW